MNKYKDIIDIKHFDPKNHPRMSIYDRSAQFAPFAALTGYDDKIEDANIINEVKKELDESVKEHINNQLNDINNNLKINNSVIIKYYSNNNNHTKYITKNIHIKKIDLINKHILTTDKEIIKFEDILNIKKT